MCVWVRVKAWPHLVVAWTGTLPIHCYHPLILLSVRPAVFLLPAFILTGSYGRGGGTLWSLGLVRIFPAVILTGRFGLRVCELHGEPLEELHFSVWCHYMRPELYVVVSLRSSSLRDKRSVLGINFVLNDKPDNILNFLIINKSYEKTKQTITLSDLEVWIHFWV